MSSTTTMQQQMTADAEIIELQLDEETDLRWEELATSISDTCNCAASGCCYATTASCAICNTAGTGIGHCPAPTMDPPDARR